MRKVIAVLFVLAGIVVIAYPSFQNQYYSAQEQGLVEEFQQLNTVFEEHSSAEEIPEGEEGSGSANSPTEEINTNAIGLIHIDKIDLTLPMLLGATDENLDIGAGVLGEDTSFGEPGNTGIAAHRSRTTGRLFNRLDEVEKGDRVVIETHDGKYEYEVYNLLIVEPEDVSVLNEQGDDSIVTLITCTIDPTHRIIVQAKEV
ncbi:class D sortase [Alkalibacillus haloalkaliphilus]|uniref:class D sortase n=1 Tax=Alkalibacillus haloalkaliphilus TaxID=94136 RepID=UPI002936C3D5|nr:class D sortase [Alkalibacillus haloalkaliphilus]MDV2581277.1 class D sortase [Alkalibacillus haloalkaliphilus]